MHCDFGPFLGCVFGIVVLLKPTPSFNLHLSLYIFPFILPSIMWSMLVLYAEKQPHTMTFPPPNFTVGMVCSGHMQWLLTSKHGVYPKSWMLVSSDQTIFPQYFSGSSKCCSANIKIPSSCFSFRVLHGECAYRPWWLSASETKTKQNKDTTQDSWETAILYHTGMEQHSSLKSPPPQFPNVYGTLTVNMVFPQLLSFFSSFWNFYKPFSLLTVNSGLLRVDWLLFELSVSPFAIFSILFTINLILELNFNLQKPNLISSFSVAFF